MSIDNTYIFYSINLNHHNRYPEYGHSDMINAENEVIDLPHTTQCPSIHAIWRFPLSLQIATQYTVLYHN